MTKRELIASLRGKKGRPRSGERNPNARLTADLVREIRSLLGKMPQIEIARNFGVTRSYVSNIATGRRWGHL